MPNLARTWSNRTLRIRQRALVETACRGEAYALEVLPQAFRGPVPIPKPKECEWGSSEDFPGGKGCSSAFIQLAIRSYPVLPDSSP